MIVSKKITFKEMNEEDFKSFLILSKKNYIDEKIRANGLSQKVASEIAEKDFFRYLPEGLSSKNNFLFQIMDSNQESLGHLWYVIRGDENNKKAFIADIYLDESARGKGFGKKSMELLEDHVKKQNLTQIELHVFGHNKAAIELYQSLDYITTDLQMVKKI